MIILIDESGNLKGGQNRYFIVGSYTTNHPLEIRSAFRKYQRSKFPRVLKNLPEIKFSNTALTGEMRLDFLNFLMKQDIRIFYTYLLVKNTPLEYRKGSTVAKTGLLYTQIIGDTLELYLPTTDKEFRVFRDSRRLKGVTKKQFKEITETRLLPQLPKGAVCTVQPLGSENVLIQVADWICGALAKHYEKKANGKKFYTVLKNNIVRGEELFKEYWSEKWGQ